MRTVILGAGGQVGSAVASALPGATVLRHADLDISAPEKADVEWGAYDVVVNAAAWTDVDGAETAHGRREAWRANASGPAALAALAGRYHLTLVHFSSEYVFDGAKPAPYAECDPVAPLGAYGASKAAGDLAVGAVSRHYVVRPTWVVGEGRNFVRTMLGLAAGGVAPTVVADQVGRPTFADDLAVAVVHLLSVGAPFGTYHVAGGGEPASWAEVARATYTLAGRGDLPISETSTAEYRSRKPGSALRPLNSVLDVSKAAAVGIELPDWRERLAAYVRSSSS